jgi:hypothetical protein
VLETLAVYIAAHLQHFRRHQLLQASAVLLKLKCREKGALEAIAEHASALLAD